MSYKKKERATKRELLRIEKTIKRELHVEIKLEMREQSVAAFERDN